MSIEGGSREGRDSWRHSAEIASETLYPGLLEQLRGGIQPEGDRAVIQAIKRAEGMSIANYGEIAQLWFLSRFDKSAHEQMSSMVEKGLCTSNDIVQVFFKMTKLGLF